MLQLWCAAPEIFESSGFMDALSSTDIKPGPRKRKISTVPATKTNTSAAVVTPVSPEDKKAAPPVCQVAV